jgi:hypothetical protein
MALKTVHPSDLSGRYIEDEGQLRRLVVREHPDLTSSELPVELEVLPDEVEKLACEESQFLGLGYQVLGEPTPRRLIVRLEESQAKGLRLIDPNDPRMREHYGLGEVA